MSFTNTYLQRTGTFADPLLTTEDSILNCTDRHDLAATGDSLYKKPRHTSLSSLVLEPFIGFLRYCYISYYLFSYYF